MSEIRSRMEVAVETAWQAGKITLRYFQSGVETEWKADSSPVTVADRSAEEYIRTAIERFFPHDVLLQAYFVR